MNEFYRFITAEAATEPSSAELLIFSSIGDWEDMGEVSAKAFAHDLAGLPTSVKRLDIHINSPGGSLFEAQAIYSRLADHRAEKIVFIDGLAASAASVLAMVGHKIYIRANATMMIHLPSGIAMGNADDMRTMAGALDTVTESMLNVYARRTKLPRADIREMLAAETWMSPDQAVAKGFADEVRGVVKAAAAISDHKAIFNGVEFDLSRFHNVPAAITANQQPTKEKPMSKRITAEDEPTPDDEPTPTPAPAPKPAAQKKKETNSDDDEDGMPEPVKKQVKKASYEDGIAAERNRIAALQELDRPATHAIVQAAIKDGKQPADIFKACMEAMDKTSVRAARHADARALDHIPPDDNDLPDHDPEGDDLAAAFVKAVDARVAQRGRNAKTRLHSRN